MLLAKVGGGERPYTKGTRYLNVPAVCDIQEERVDDKPRALVMLVDLKCTDDDVRAQRRAAAEGFATAGGQVAISAEYQDADKVLDSMRRISDKFHLAEISYPDGDED
eukprot:1686669-Amphidinium_carterae.1